MTKASLLASTILLMISFLFGCNEQTETAVEDEGSKGVFYKVTYENNTAYLFGSFHFSNRSLLPLNEKIEDAYDKSDFVAVEINPRTISPSEQNSLIREIGTYTDGTTIDAHLSSDVYEKLMETLNDLDMNENLVQNYKPWLIIDTLLGEVLFNQGGVSYDLGIDHYFLNKATSDGKEIIELETLEDKFQVYKAASPELQELGLKTRLLELDKMDEIFEEEVTAWINGDIEAMTAYREFELDGADPEDSQASFDAFYLERDRNMTGKMEEFLKNGESQTYFVIVGAYHLVGEESIVDLLKTRGYDVEKVIE